VFTYKSNENKLRKQKTIHTKALYAGKFIIILMRVLARLQKSNLQDSKTL